MNVDQSINYKAVWQPLTTISLSYSRQWHNQDFWCTPRKSSWIRMGFLKDLFLLVTCVVRYLPHSKVDFSSQSQHQLQMKKMPTLVETQKSKPGTCFTKREFILQKRKKGK